MLAFGVMTRNHTLRETISIPDTIAGRSVVLVGLMGAGKTSIGRRLAARIGLPFRDADQEIELAAGCTIPELFARYGEPAFRDGERRVIRRLLAGDPMVLAFGGGAFMDEQTREAARAEAVTVWLRCTLPTLVRRVATRDNRPLLYGRDREETLRQLMEARYPVYAEADVIVDCGDEPPDHTTTGVLNALLEWKPARRLHVILPTTSYDVVIGDNLLGRAGALLAPKLPQKRAVVVTDQAVAGLHLQTLLSGLAETAIERPPSSSRAARLAKTWIPTPTWSINYLKRAWSGAPRLLR